MDVNKLDASWARAQARWAKVVSLWDKCKVVVGTILVVGVVIALIAFIPYAIWDLSVHPVSRHAASAAAWKQFKWYLGFVVVSWVIGKFWRKKPNPPVEIDDGVLHEESVQGSKPETHQGRRKHRNNRRVQRRR